MISIPAVNLRPTDFKAFLNVVFDGEGRIIAVGVGGNLQRADSEAVLVETAEPINCDTESGRISIE